MNLHNPMRIASLALGAVVLGWTSPGMAQPTFGNPSPTAGSATSQKANESADQALYQPVVYANASKKGPAVIIIPGEIKSNNANFLQKFTANNIADFGEVEMSSANFQGLERSNLGPILNEFQLAYNLGDPEAARKFLRMGKLKSTKYIVKFDILKTEQVAAAQQGFDGADRLAPIEKRHSVAHQDGSAVGRTPAALPVPEPPPQFVELSKPQLPQRHHACGADDD
jgi:hypothetical protein